MTDEVGRQTGGGLQRRLRDGQILAYLHADEKALVLAGTGMDNHDRHP